MINIKIEEKNIKNNEKVIEDDKISNINYKNHQVF